MEEDDFSLCFTNSEKFSHIALLGAMQLQNIYYLFLKKEKSQMTQSLANMNDLMWLLLDFLFSSMSPTVVICICKLISGAYW